MTEKFDFKKEVKREHIEAARNYILNRGKEKGDVLYIGKRVTKRALIYKEKKYSIQDLLRVAIVYYDLKEGESVPKIIDIKKFKEIKEKIEKDHEVTISLKMKVIKPYLLTLENEDSTEMMFTDKDFIRLDEDGVEGIMNEDEDENEYDILTQFHQIIFYGPPGTGKTYRAMEMLPNLLSIDAEDIKKEQGERWDIVQFHPSYNYEDFVRGVKVETKEINGKTEVIYKTVDRIFGEICQRAKEDEDNNYVLIIDEINRANVSAVLGELIYALEYRGKEIKTPYKVDDKKDEKKVDDKKDGDMLVIPKNLYIIGTMNTADRTIGQIDYAVRRRFAFMHCPPKCEVIEEHLEEYPEEYPEEHLKYEDILGIYAKVEKLFKEGKEKEYLSRDYEAADVQIGHSYFLHDEKRKDISLIKQIALKILYQVVPVLQEYVKDGVLTEGAKGEIEGEGGIKEKAKDLLDSGLEDSELLEQFHQIIFYGPPGTGKTYSAMKMLPMLLDDMDEEQIKKAQGNRWDIVQFHPSYNYEDFVRGVKVETVKTKDGKTEGSKTEVKYSTVDRIFGDICKRASSDKTKKYVLIIDEINRANVSAVLGELIYALEYRGESIKTPYKVDGDGERGDMLVIPENLYIIGTMNTADRTIGQIDYAVRRRFAFIHCPPKREIIEEHLDEHSEEHLKNEDVLGIYDSVQELFKEEGEEGEEGEGEEGEEGEGEEEEEEEEEEEGEEGEEGKEYLSRDYEAADVQIGHSYFLHDEERNDEIPPIKQIALKIIYQVVPVLQEYIKDGILSEDAKGKIEGIEKNAKELLGGVSRDSRPVKKGARSYYYWKAMGKEGAGIVRGFNRVSFAALKDFIENLGDWYEAWDFKRLLDKFNEFTKNDCITTDFVENEYFPDKINLNGENIYISKQWDGNQWDGGVGFMPFKAIMRDLNYSIGHCCIVNIDETGGFRNWEVMRELGFLSGGGGDGGGDEKADKEMATINPNDGIFAYRSGKDEGENGVVAFGIVDVEREYDTAHSPKNLAIDIEQFKLNDGHLLRKVDFGGESYKDKFKTNRSPPESFFRMEWIDDWETPIKIEGIPLACQKGISEDDIEKLKDKFES